MPLQVRARARHCDPPDLEHVGAAGRGERKARVLLDDQHGHALPLVQLADPCVEVGHHARCKPQRRLVEQQQSRPLHQRAGERQLLLLAAAQGSGRLSEALGEDRKPFERVVVVGLDADPVAADMCAEPQVLIDGQLHEGPAALGYVCDPRPGDRLGPAREPFPRKDDLAARLDRGRDRAQCRRLAGAVRAEDRDDLALVDREVDSLQSP